MNMFVGDVCAICTDINIIANRQDIHLITLMYISFNSKEPLTSLTKLNNCISDIRVWMIKNKLKINDSKTEFIIFRSPLLKTDLSGVSINVGDSQISSSPKVRDLGVIFDSCLSLDAHISNICRSTHFHLRNIGRIRTLLTFHATAQLIHALITTRLDFCNSILYNLPNNKITITKDTKPSSTYANTFSS